MNIHDRFSWRNKRNIYIREESTLSVGILLDDTKCLTDLSDISLVQIRVGIQIIVFFFIFP